MNAFTGSSVLSISIEIGGGDLSTLIKINDSITACGESVVMGHNHYGLIWVDRFEDKIDEKLSFSLIEVSSRLIKKE